MPLTRRTLLRQAAATPLIAATAGALAAASAEPFSISLAQWSLHRSYFGQSFGPQFRTLFRADPDSVLQGDHDPLAIVADRHAADFSKLASQEYQ